MRLIHCCSTGGNGMGLVLLLLVPLLLSMRIFVMLASEPSLYSPEHLDCRPYRGEKVAKCTEFREAVSHAGDHFFQLGYVHALAYERNPPRIIVGIEEEKYRAIHGDMREEGRGIQRGIRQEAWWGGTGIGRS